MAKIFISHSSKDKDMVIDFVDFLQKGMGFGRGDIFCTSYPNALPTGEEFIAKIKTELVGCEAAFLMITDNYLSSQFCMAELGAVWGLGKRIFPLLTVDIEKMNRTPLLGMQMRLLNRKDHMEAVYDEFCKYGIISKPSVGEFNSSLTNFMQKLKQQMDGEYLLRMDADGYYHTEILAEREISRSECRCYKIKGHVDEWRGENFPSTDWLFFFIGKFEDLKVGDKVRFRIKDVRVQTWNNLGLARDIFPADLQKEG